VSEQSNQAKSIQGRLLEIQHRFLSLLEEIPEKDWDRKISAEGWTIKQEMVHIVQVLEVLPAGIERACRGSKRSLLGFIPSKLRNWANGQVIIPLRAKNQTRESIASAYQDAHDALINILMNLEEEDWEKGMPFPKKFRTVEQMAYRPVEHFDEHERHLRRVLGMLEDS
jgi:hypothetical protein